MNRKPFMYYDVSNTSLWCYVSPIISYDDVYVIPFRTGVDRLYSLSFLWMREAVTGLTIVIAIFISAMTGRYNFGWHCLAHYIPNEKHLLLS